jgi:hypothetical protein
LSGSSGSIKRGSTSSKEKEEEMDVWSTTKTNTEMADTVDNFSTSVNEENVYGTSVTHEEVQQPPPKKGSKKTVEKEKPVDEERDIYSTSVINEYEIS